MNSRERFLATMAFEPVDRPPLWEFGYWADTVRRWYREGLPEHAGIPSELGVAEQMRAECPGHKYGAANDQDVHDAIGLDPGIVRIPVNNWLYPEFEPVQLEDHGDWELVRDAWGTVRRQKKDKSTIPEFVSGPVSTLDDWERLSAERLNPSLQGRLAPTWAEFLAGARQPTYPIAIGSGQGFFGTPRFLLGVTELFFAFYDKPKLVKKITADLANFWVALYDQALTQVKADVAFIWEDMCYKNGPMISPAMFEEFMLPSYRKLTRFFRDHGIRIILVDTDGDCRGLIPQFLKAGVTGLYPMEVTSGMNIAEVGAQYPRLQLMGGLSKVAIGQGKEAIDCELEAKIPPLLRRGGYIPFVDHVVPPTVSWDDFCYYRRKIASLVH